MDFHKFRFVLSDFCCDEHLSSLAVRHWLKQANFRILDADKHFSNLKTMLGISIRCLPAGLAGGLYIQTSHLIHLALGPLVRRGRQVIFLEY